MNIKLLSNIAISPEVKNGIVEIKSPKKITILPLGDALIDLDLSVEYFDEGYVAILIEDFSVLVKNNITIPTTIIKQKENIRIQIINHSQKEYARFDIGDKLCKIVLIPILRTTVTIEEYKK